MTIDVEIGYRRHRLMCNCETETEMVGVCDQLTL